MSDELDRKELVHPWGAPEEKFMALIDATGGWPHGYRYVSFFHDGPCGNRWCKFTNTELRTGWWTTVASSDDYYWWKLSPERKEKELAAARKQLIAQLR
jgi:hypothetical protein